MSTYPAATSDPVAYVNAAAAWLAELETEEDDYPLALVARRLAVIALDREAAIISLRNKLGELELELEERGRADHPAGALRRLRYVTGGNPA
jgi:hypothetical protein